MPLYCYCEPLQITDALEGTITCRGPLDAANFLAFLSPFSNVSLALRILLILQIAGALEGTITCRGPLDAPIFEGNIEASLLGPELAQAPGEPEEDPSQGQPQGQGQGLIWGKGGNSGALSQLMGAIGMNSTVNSTGISPSITGSVTQSALASSTSLGSSASGPNPIPGKAAGELGGVGGGAGAGVGAGSGGGGGFVSPAKAKEGDALQALRTYASQGAVAAYDRLPLASASGSFSFSTDDCVSPHATV